jgi:hypothetical protein
MCIDGQPLRVAIASQLMVHPAKRGRVGLQLVKTFFSGPQDLSITDGNDVSRSIWEGLGAVTLPLYSIRWTRPLSATRYLLSSLKRHAMASTAVSVLTPVACTLDVMLGHLGRWSFRVSPPQPGLIGEELTETDLLAGLSEVSRARSIRPEYDERSMKWLFRMLTDRSNCGRLRKVLVRNGGGKTVGWYMYYLNPRGTSEVMQIGAPEGLMTSVLGHLFHDARMHGAVAVTGQLDPRFIQQLSDATCLMHGKRNSWVLAHAKRPERLEPLQRGDAWLTRLEGESWVGFPQPMRTRATA